MANDNKSDASMTEVKTEKYEKLIDRLKEERKAVENMLDKDYREARRYVRSHPEEGVFAAFAGGIALGFILGRISK
ncbi:hypothetical protein SAMN05443144_101238 [Fodinibius roseus]|uniref:Uncharacterized protein n=1 Tax=Fodinibius roseus TaxID=1194090 RepID=A0A1M4T965_9BACT|nr:hypothetical protein [Fodinibius roseus]SHE40878.1 hypothetical protein SAMN05443144_101238 [Fodinibius roseus]